MPVALYAYKDESFLVLELRKQGMLLDIVNQGALQGPRSRRVPRRALRHVLRYRSHVHTRGSTAQASSTTASRSTTWAAQYDPAGEGGWRQTFVGDWAMDVRDCFKMHEGRPWTFQTNYPYLYHTSLHNICISKTYEGRNVAILELTVAQPYLSCFLRD